MNFRSVSDMDRVIREKLSLIPSDVELIVGVPRSGMLPATLLAVYLNLPLTDTMSIASGASHAASTRDYRLKSSKNSTDIRDYKKILVIDDSCYTGLSINEVKESIASIPDCDTEILYACVYVMPEATSCVDIYFEIVPSPRVFEWNIMNHSVICQSCFDLDGVLCVDPTEEQNDDGEKYIDFILNAKPLWTPKFTIGVIVTSRLEKYRSYTEKWLSEHNISYQHLIMLNLRSKEERIRMGAHAPFKASVYDQIAGTKLFIESDPDQARYIAEATGKAVYCVSTNEFYDEIHGVDEYLETKTSLEQYADQLSNVIGKLRILAMSIGGGSADTNVVSALTDSWDAVISDMESMYSSDSVIAVDQLYTRLRNSIEEKDNAKCVKLADELDSLCRDVILKETTRLTVDAADMVTDAAWRKELELIQSILNKALLESDDYDDEYKSEVDYLRSIGRLQMYPYKWTEEYREDEIKVLTNETGLKYVDHNGHELHLPPYSDDLAKHEYNQLIMEQDERSPHRYFDDICDFEEGDIFVDVGAAEGMISLDVVEKSSEIYLIECSDKWIRALNETFGEYLDKVHIIPKYAGNIDSGNCITLDSLLSEYSGKRIFIKMDIEGMEMDALQGAITTMKNNHCHVSVAVYHTQSQERDIREFFDNVGYNSYPSDGYVLFIYGRMALSNGKYERIAPPYFRRAIVRATPGE
ncbi:MAG: FkbM family methyltransferase [Lachnospiraceae bacterium]|nr:FkbM family methyltransferase [Lachnospiraceae bacterium]